MKILEAKLSFLIKNDCGCVVNCMYTPGIFGDSTAFTYYHSHNCVLHIDNPCGYDVAKKYLGVAEAMFAAGRKSIMEGTF